MKRMIQHCYSKVYDDVVAPENTKTRPLINAKVFVLGEKYDLSVLKKVAADRFAGSLYEEFKILDTTDDPDVALLQDVIEFVYEHATQGDITIRAALAIFCYHEAAHLFGTEWFEGMIAAHPRLGVDLLVKQQKELKNKDDHVKKLESKIYDGSPARSPISP